jgi:hypothetical protein
LGCIWLARNGRLVGLLCWPGALLYVFYNYTAYVFGRPFDWLTFVYLAIVLLSAYAIVDLLKNVDQKAVQAQLSDAVPHKTAGWVLVVFGVLFLFRAVGVMAQASMSQATLPISDVGVLTADVVVSLFWTAGGVLLLRRMPLGYASGLGLLFGASLLFAGLIMFFLLQPLLTDAPFALTDLIVIALMSLICFVPTWLFARGVMGKGGYLR